MSLTREEHRKLRAVAKATRRQDRRNALKTWVTKDWDYKLLALGSFVTATIFWIALVVGAFTAEGNPLPWAIAATGTYVGVLVIIISVLVTSIRDRKR